VKVPHAQPRIARALIGTTLRQAGEICRDPVAGGGQHLGAAAAQRPQKIEVALLVLGALGLPGQCLNALIE
jgi:hypothetical protein